MTRKLKRATLGGLLALSLSAGLVTSYNSFPVDNHRAASNSIAGSPGGNSKGGPESSATDLVVAGSPGGNSNGGPESTLF
ncbi:MAG TPA: hypothetical protein VH186_14415 [Chloroflexia bacterium]|nr:hypothetical protein [Chloroflexia bacterium]